jgi:HSP20 family protein
MNSAVLNAPVTPTATSAATPPSPHDHKPWKAAALALAGLVAVLAAAVGVESYSLISRAPRAEAPKPAESKPQALPAPAPLAVLPDWSTPWAAGSVNSWDRLNALQQEMDQMFNRTLSQLSAQGPELIGGFSGSSFDLREQKDAYVVRADMPGADKASIKVNVEGRMVTISGERTSLTESKADNAVLGRERRDAQFVRTIQLPGPVKVAEVDAKYDNGVLTLTLPKADKDTATTQVTVH